MSVALALAIYFIIWWVVLFTVLPFNIRTQAEEGDIAPGTVSSAPARVPFLRIVLVTSAVSAIVLAVGYMVHASGLVTLDDFPFLPEPVAL